jgi:cytoskeletal protein RodZ
MMMRTARITSISTGKKPVGAFGDKFRLAREAKGISLDDVSNVTKIGSRMLQAIEQEHFDQLPGGVFNKGFIRAYAKHLGLNDEDAVTSYLACLRQSQIDAQQQAWQPQSTPPSTVSRPGISGQRQSEKTQPAKGQLAKPQPQPYTKPAMTAQPPIQVEAVQIELDQNRSVQTNPAQTEDELPHLQLPRAEDVRPRRRDYPAARETDVPWNILAAVAVVILLLAFLWIRHSHNTRTEAATPVTPAAVPAASNPTATQQPPSQQPSTTPSTQPSAPATANSKVNSATNSQPNSPTNIPPITNPAGTNPPTTNSKTSKATTSPAHPNNDADNDPNNDVTIRTFPPTKPAKPAPSFTLIIRATENSWVSITADGRSVAHENLIAPAATSIRATHEIIARIGNAGGVTFLWNGQEIPAQGAESELKTFLFDSSGMHEVPNQPPASNH